MEFANWDWDWIVQAIWTWSECIFRVGPFLRTSPKKTVACLLAATLSLSLFFPFLSPSFFLFCVIERVCKNITKLKK